MLNYLLIFPISLALVFSCSKVNNKVKESNKTESKNIKITKKTTKTPKSIKKAVDSSKPGFDLSKVSNLSRIKGLTPRQKKLLAKNGFFIAHQPMEKQAKTKAQKRTARGATHLFHIYERNDYIRLPSFVTADVAIDMTHAYFTSLIKSLEYKKFIPLLKVSLGKLSKETDTLLSKTVSSKVKKEVERTALFWAVALRLLEQPSKGDKPDLKKRIEPDHGKVKITRFSNKLEPLVKIAVKKVFSAKGTTILYPAKNKVLLDKMKPRGNYTRSGDLQRYFRTMSWLGLLKYNIKGENKDIKGILMLSRSLLVNHKAAQKLKAILDVTGFIVGKPDSVTLDKSSKILKSSVKNASKLSIDKLLSSQNINAFEAKLKNLPASKIMDNNGETTPHVCVMGKRSFNDAQAMQKFIRFTVDSVNTKAKNLIPVLMGGVGSATVLGSKTAFNAVLELTPKSFIKSVTNILKKGVLAYSKIKSGNFKDAYHGTLYSLQSLLTKKSNKYPKMMQTKAWQKKSLFAYCGGWAELRHDTILFGKELGAECDAPDEEAVSCWVEPEPQLYSRLIKMVSRLNAKLKIIDKISSDNKEIKETLKYQRKIYSIANKADSLIKFLKFLLKVTKLEMAHKPLNNEIRDRIMILGGDMEWLLATFAESDLLSERDKDMAIVADVFNFLGNKGKREVVEVGIADPDLIYALIPKGDGYVIARGGVMSYREFTWPSSDRLTDEKWKKMLKKNSVADIPKWIKEIYAEPVKAILLPKGKSGRERCGMNSGSDYKL